MILGGSLPCSQQPTTCPYPSQIDPFLCPSHFWQAQFVSFLVGLRTYQHSGTRRSNSRYFWVTVRKKAKYSNGNRIFVLLGCYAALGVVDTDVSGQLIGPIFIGLIDPVPGAWIYAKRLDHLLLVGAGWRGKRVRGATPRIHHLFQKRPLWQPMNALPTQQMFLKQTKRCLAVPRWTQQRPSRADCSCVLCNRVGRDSSVVRATRYERDGPGIEFRWRRDLPHCSRPSLGPN